MDHLRHPLAVEIRALLSRERSQHNRILIDDEENVLQAVAAQVAIEAVYFSGENQLSERLLQQLPPQVPIHEIATRTCKKIFDKERVSRLFAVATRPEPVSVEALLQSPHDLVVADNLSISGNVGAIIRTSLALRAGGLIMLDGDLDPYDRRVIRASRGYLFSLPIATATADMFIAACERQGRALVVMTSGGDISVDRLASLPGPVALAFGGEKSGCSPAVLEAATHRMRIPIDPRVESLNVSVAAAIALFSRGSSA